MPAGSYCETDLLLRNKPKTKCKNFLKNSIQWTKLKTFTIDTEIDTVIPQNGFLLPKILFYYGKVGWALKFHFGLSHLTQFAYG